MRSRYNDQYKDDFVVTKPAGIAEVYWGGEAKLSKAIALGQAWYEDPSTKNMVSWTETKEGKPHGKKGAWTLKQGTGLSAEGFQTCSKHLMDMGWSLSIDKQAQKSIENEGKIPATILEEFDEAMIFLDDDARSATTPCPDILNKVNCLCFVSFKQIQFVC